ncbi:MAG TPA: hypothetical protein VJ732_13340 [Bryobacteraceae bacterium]|nr:hypothetical protein [Bryobacteraceae bacterium]
MQYLYKALLRLYPKDLRAAFSAEMIEVFEQAAAEHRSRGRACYLRFAAKECAGLVGGAAFEWTARAAGRARRREAPAPAGTPSLPAEVAEAQRLVDVSVARMVEAIATREFAKARFYSIAERKAREQLRLLRQKYQLPE